MSEATDVKDNGGIYSMTESMFDALERQIITSKIMKAMNMVVRDIARDTVSGAVIVRGTAEKFPGPVSRDDMEAVLTRLLPGKFPSSEGASFAAPDAKFPPLYPPNKKDADGHIIRNDEGFARKDYTHRPADEILKQAYNEYCRLVSSYANPEGKYHALCQIDPVRYKDVLDVMAKGDIGAIRDRLVSISPTAFANKVNATGCGPADCFMTVRDPDAKAEKDVLLMNSWTFAARQSVMLDIIRAYATKCATPREDCADGLVLNTKLLMDRLEKLGFDRNMPFYQQNKGEAVALEDFAKAMAYGVYARTAELNGIGAHKLTSPTPAEEKSIAAVPEKLVQEIEQSILANADAAPQLMDAGVAQTQLMDAGEVKNLIKDMAAEAAFERQDEATAIASEPDGPDMDTAKPRRGRPRKA